MLKEILKRRVGRTPLIRAKKLEKELGISKIYLKLEGNNPSGHREDRLAYLIIREALSRKKNTICIGTYGTVGGSLALLTEHFDIRCVFIVPSKEKILRGNMLQSSHIDIIEYGRTYEDSVMESRRLAEENGWYDANPGLDNNMMNMYAFEYVAKEINDSIGGEIDNVFCQTGNGSSISGLHMGYKRMWVLEEIDILPRINAVSTAHGNAIIESYKKNSKELLSLSHNDTRESRYNRNLINWKCFNGQDALNAIYDTDGKAIGISDEELIEYAKRFRELENIDFSMSNAFPIAAFFKLVEKGQMKNGIHVLILNDAKVDLNIEIIDKKDLMTSHEDFLKTLDEWLVQFTDSMEEMEEAVENAFKEGYVICAFHEGVIVGITIISRSGFKKFFPKYHLSYIATKREIKGKGIATQLLQKAIEVTGGDLSLHVEIENKRAIKLYEKMGLRKKYYRMFYKGEVL
ncbi:MAG: pyridoxal-phosphate dependent enzyme [Thermoplasmata archaeon]|nr:pyridoxal-phosphate dependent enzyme [Thermoplasmata archaeon]